jgi:hypothetical protein
MDQLASFLSAYEEARGGIGSSVELEARFAIPSIDEYTALLRNMIKTPGARLLPLSRTIVLIKDGTGTAGRNVPVQPATMTYRDTGLRVEKDGPFAFSSKHMQQTLKVPDSFVPYKFAVSTEARADQWNVEIFTRIRIKLRLSVIVDSHPGWRFDFTLAIELTTMTNLVQQRENLFRPGLTSETFADSAPFEVAQHLELEAEWVGDRSPSSEEIYAMLDFVRDTGGFKYAETTEYQRVVFEVAKLIKSGPDVEKFRTKLGRRALSDPPIGLDKRTWQTKLAPNAPDYFATIKADGEGIIGLITGIKVQMLGGQLETRELKGGSSSTDNSPIVYEAEVLKDGRQLVYDVFFIGGEKLIDVVPLRERIKRIPEVVTILGGLSANVFAKEYTKLTTNYRAELKALWSRKYDFPVDGIVFDREYKWKPLSNLTIDFLVMRPPKVGVIGIAPHLERPGFILLFLFCGIYRHQQSKYRMRPVAGYNSMFVGRTFYDYSPIQFSPPNKPYAYIWYAADRADAPTPTPKSQSKVMGGVIDAGDASIDDIIGHICEFHWNAVDQTWELERVRHDRDLEVARGSYFGNNIHVAFATWANIMDPLTIEGLTGEEVINGPVSYFAETDRRYKYANAFSSFAKNKSLSGWTDLPWVVDLAAGRGADLGRWGRMRIKHALCIDNDADALTEIHSRLAQAQRELKHYKTIVHTHKADLNDDHKTTLASIRASFSLPRDGVPLAVCNMAIHYFCESDVSISNFAKLVAALIAPGGHFVFTCYNGARVFNELVGRERVDLYSGESLSYSIIRRYPANAEFQSFGQVIEPMLACAGGIYRSEYLVNIDYVVRVFKGLGFALVRQVAFGELLEEYSIEELEKHDKLDDADVANVSRFDYVILRKEEAKGGALPTETPAELAPNHGPIDAGMRIATSDSSHFGNVALAIPTKEIMETLTVDDPGALADGRIRYIALPAKIKYSRLVIGDRIAIVDGRDVMIESTTTYSTFSKLFAAIPVTQLDRERSQDAYIARFLEKYETKRLTKNGVVLLGVRPL